MKKTKMYSAAFKLGKKIYQNIPEEVFEALENKRTKFIENDCSKIDMTARIESRKLTKNERQLIKEYKKSEYEKYICSFSNKKTTKKAFNIYWSKCGLQTAIDIINNPSDKYNKVKSEKINKFKIYHGFINVSFRLFDDILNDNNPWNSFNNIVKYFNEGQDMIDVILNKDDASQYESYEPDLSKFKCSVTCVKC